MELTAEDIMTRDVVCVSKTTTMQELVEILISKRIGGVPVVDEDGKLVGIISKTDLVTHGLEKELRTLLSDEKRRLHDHELPDLDNLLGPEPSMIAVESIMKTQVITASKDTNIYQLVKIMLKHRIHRIVIAENNKIAGIVTTVDVLRKIDIESTEMS